MLYATDHYEERRKEIKCHRHLFITLYKQWCTSPQSTCKYFKEKLIINYQKIKLN